MKKYPGRMGIACLQAASLALLALMHLSQPAMAAENGAGLSEALWRDSEIDLHFRSYALDRDKPDGADSRAWASGGWLAYRSGWLADRLRLGLTAHTSQKLYGPDEKDGASLLLAGQKSYSVLGESFGAMKFHGQVLTAGRFLVNQYEVNPQDTRMSPRTFRGLSLTGKVGDLTYFLGRLDQMKSRNWNYFKDIATVAGAPNGVKEPLLLCSAHYAPSENLNLILAAYRVPNLIASAYTEISWAWPLTDDTKIRFGGQHLHQGSTGADLLTGTPFKTWTSGIKTEILHGPFNLAVIAMKTDQGAAYRTPFGSWPGYTSRIINNFNRAGELAWAIDAAVDFTKLGAPGLSLIASTTSGDHAINAATGSALAKNTEHDLTADYRFTASAWPQWAKTIWLRARLARFEQKLGDTVEVTTERHLILNYTINLK